MAMDQSQLGWIAGFIWRIADDVLRDVYVRGKCRDVILPMTVIRRLGSILEPTKAAVLETRSWSIQSALCLQQSRGGSGTVVGSFR